MPDNPPERTRQVDIRALAYYAGQLLDAAMIYLPSGSAARDKVVEARALLTRLDEAMEAYASRPDPKFGRVWCEAKPFYGEPVWLVRACDRLAVPHVYNYLTMAAALGQRIDTVKTVAEWMADWKEKRYVD